MQNARSSRRFSLTKAQRLGLLASGTAVLFFAGAAASAQTYTSPSSGTFTNPLVWNFGAGPVPASDAALALTFQSYSFITAGNDLNLTINRLDLATYGTVAPTLSNAPQNGDYAFTGGAGTINLLGSGQRPRSRRPW